MEGASVILSGAGVCVLIGGQVRVPVRLWYLSILPELCEHRVGLARRLTRSAMLGSCSRTADPVACEVC